MHNDTYLITQYSGYFDFSAFATLSWRKRILPSSVFLSTSKISRTKERLFVRLCIGNFC